MYILGRREAFEGCYELRQAFEQLLQRPDKLSLVTGELWPSQRKQSEDAKEAVPGEVLMEGVEHLGQYVFEMTKTKMEQLHTKQELPPAMGMALEEIEPIPEEDEEDDE